MFDVIPIDSIEKNINRQGQLSHRQKDVFASKARSATAVSLFFLLVSTGVCSLLALASPSQREMICGIAGPVAIFGPGIIIISGYYALKNFFILRRAKVIKYEGRIHKTKTRQWTRDSIKWYDHWIIIDGSRVSIGKREYDELQEVNGTVYYLSTSNIQKQFLFIDY